MSQTRTLLQLLHRNYIRPGQDLPGGVFLPEVGWNGGPNAGRADALYVGFTSTSGRLLVGHEIKVSRSDWRAELDKQGKADPWHDQCHAWYVVAPSTDVVPVEELPHGWGLMLPGRSQTRMQIKVKAHIRADHTPSWTAVRSIMARQDTLRAQEIRQIRHEAEEKARQKLEREHQERAERLARMSGDRSAETLRDIEQRLGCSFSDFMADNHVTPRQFADALTIARARESLTHRWDGLNDLIRNLSTTKKRAEQLAAALERPEVTDG